MRPRMDTVVLGLSLRRNENEGPPRKTWDQDRTGHRSPLLGFGGLLPTPKHERRHSGNTSGVTVVGAGVTGRPRVLSSGTSP